MLSVFFKCPFNVVKDTIRDSGKTALSDSNKKYFSFLWYSSVATFLRKFSVKMIFRKVILLKVQLRCAGVSNRLCEEHKFLKILWPNFFFIKSHPGMLTSFLGLRLLSRYFFWRLDQYCFLRRPITMLDLHMKWTDHDDLVHQVKIIDLIET